MVSDNVLDRSLAGFNFISNWPVGGSRHGGRRAQPVQHGHALGPQPWRNPGRAAPLFVVDGGHCHSFHHGKLAFSSGLCWSAFYGNNELWVRSNLAQEQQWQLQYLHLPLMVHCRWHGAHAGAGYQLGIPVAGDITFTDHNTWMGMPDQRSSTHRLDLLHADAGIVAEAVHDLGKKFGVGLRYYRGLSDIKDHSDGLRDPLYPEQFVLVVSYGLLPKAKPVKPEVPVPASPEPR